MPVRTYEFVQVDVFTQTPLAGNPLAIFPDAQGLTDDEMQAFAREMNLSETTFILARDAATEAREGKKVRIFTVEEELPFAGHPTLGTALYMYASEFLKNTGANFFYFLCPEWREGRLEVRARMFFYGGEDPATGSAAGCAASWMVQHGVAKTDEQVLIRQGIECRRPSEMYVRATREGERVTNVRVGGYAVEILRGTVVL